MKQYSITQRVKLDFYENNPHAHLVPQSKAFENHKAIVEQVGIAINKRIPVLLVGETGTGKTSLVRHLAEKTNNSFRCVNHNGGTSVEDIIGKTLINEKGTFWVDGVLIEAMRKGYWYLADEINASNAEINFAYHSLLDDDGYIVIPENNGEIVKPHDSFRFFASMNPEYAGTKELNSALLSRFMVVKIEFPPPSVESHILTSRTKVSKEVSGKMVKFAGELRSSHANEKIGYVLSTRDLLMWAEMYGIYKKYIPSAEIAVLNKVSKEDYQATKDLLNLHFKTLDNPKEKPHEVEKPPFQIGEKVYLRDKSWIGFVLKTEKINGEWHITVDNNGKGLESTQKTSLAKNVTLST